ncbi:MAG TPA: 23S rRNA (uracil(1939)-C(5))-methyltransferase RlmD [bacterium]|nr:23S rRNA (uracil(1939)-C(5))-methyltransferase RlmD [bacterium]
MTHGESRVTSHKSRREAPPLKVGQKATLRFHAFNAAGAGVATYGPQTVAVPFALPGEEAVVEVTAATRLHAQGRMTAVLRKSAEVVEPRCRHFGRCGGCQWQHLPYQAQLAAKTQLVRSVLAGSVDAGAVVRDALGSQPWQYRSRLQAAFALRRERTVAGFSSVADEVVINIQECPIQHPVNVRILLATREIVGRLGWPVYDRGTGTGVLRGVIAQTAFATGESMLVLCTTADVPDRMAFVRAATERLPELRSVMISVRRPTTAELLGRTELLWGRPFITEVLSTGMGGGVRLNLYAAPSIPPNPGAFATYLGAVRRAVGAARAVIDVACDEGLIPLALSLASGEGPAQSRMRVVGVTADRESMRRAWENATANGAEGCVFYTRAPAAVLAKLRARGATLDVLMATGRGGTVPPAVAAEAAAAGCGRIVYAGSSMTRLVDTIRSAGAAGYRLTDVQPVDLLPQTARVHVVATLMRYAS